MGHIFLPYIAPPAAAGNYYLKWSANSGGGAGNNELLEISGITGTLTSVQYTLKETPPAYVSGVTRYLFDIRRDIGVTTDGGGTGYILYVNAGNIDSSGTSSHTINGSAATAKDFYDTAVADDVCKFTVNATPSDGCIAFGARYNEVEHFHGLAVSQITIVDGAGTHVIDMSDSGGTGTSVVSDTTNLTATLYNFPGDDSQWVSY